MFIKKMTPIFILFVVVNALSFIGMENHYPIGMNLYFIIVVNTMLLFMAILSYYRIQKMDATNANAMVRSVMLGTLLKMGVFAVAALVYATQKKAPIGTNNLFIAMGLYLVYTWIEIGWTKRRKDA